MDKYEKKLNNIWKTFDPKNPNEELNTFIRKNHPSVIQFRNIISREIDQRTWSLRFFRDEKFRKEIIEDTIHGGAMIYLGDLREDPNKKIEDIYYLRIKEFIDNDLSRMVYGIELIGGTNIKSKWINKPEEGGKKVYSYYLKSEVERWGKDEEGCTTREDVLVDPYTEEHLNHMWNLLWTNYAYEEGWIDKKWSDYSTENEIEELKKLIWDDYENDFGMPRGGLKSEQLKRFKTSKIIMSNHFVKEIKMRVKKAQAVVDAFKDACKETNPTFSERKEPYFDHLYHHELTWDRQYVCEDLWKDFDIKETYLKIEERDFS